MRSRILPHGREQFGIGLAVGRRQIGGRHAQRLGRELGTDRAGRNSRAPPSTPRDSTSWQIRSTTCAGRQRLAEDFNRPLLAGFAHHIAAGAEPLAQRGQRPSDDVEPGQGVSIRCDLKI